MGQRELTDGELADRLGAHIAALTSAGPRHATNLPGVVAAGEYITSTLTELGCGVSQQRYGDAPHQVNFTAEFGTDPAVGTLEVGAHWDSISVSPGADDNASGVAALLEIARELARGHIPSPVRLCFFGEEEAGGFPGSTAHLKKATENGGHILAGIVLEMISYRDTSPRSQQVPKAAALALRATGRRPPKNGDFIAVLGDTSASPWVAALATAAKGLAPPLPAIPLTAPAAAIRDAARSDHAAYWAQGLPGVMLTDTANFRNPHYHKPSDTLETLDLEFAAQVTRMVVEVITNA